MFGLSEVLQIISVIHQQAKDAKANQEQCKRLIQRICLIEQLIRPLENLKDISSYQKGIDSLHKTLSECAVFIENLSGKNWFQLALKAGTCKDKFSVLNHELAAGVQLLQLGMDVKQLTDHQQDLVDQEADRVSFSKKQDEIIELNYAANKKLHRLDVNIREYNDLLAGQLTSMKIHLKALAHNADVKPLIDPHYHLHYFELKFDGKLSAGDLGEIYLGRWREYTKVLIKTLGNTFLAAEEKAVAANPLIREIQIVSRLRHSNIAQFYGACLEPARTCLVIEYLNGGSLFDILGKEKLTHNQQQRIALDIAQGLYYLHTQGICHRDLRSHHVLLDDQGGAKLTEFGFASIRSASIRSLKEQKRVPLQQWQPPEFFERGKEYTAKSDIFSFGVILWELMTSQRPYANLSESELANHLLSGKRETITKDIPIGYAELIQACWQADPEKRPELPSIIQQLKMISAQQRPISPTGEEYYQQGCAREKLKDYSGAFINYEKSSSKGFYRAKTNLGLLFLANVDGIPVNKEKAYQNFLEAAEKSHVRAMFNVATMLEYGDGVKKDLQQALQWYDAASKLGDKKATEKVIRVQQKLKELSVAQNEQKQQNSQLQTVNRLSSFGK